MKADLKRELTIAMKAKEQARVDTIRLLLSALQYEEVEKKVEELSSTDFSAILQREIKKLREEMEFAEKAGRSELLKSLEGQIKTIEEFLPKQLTGVEIEKIIVELKGSTPGLNMGSCMKILKEKFAGQYDAKIASDMAKKLLSA